jgi:hypothetical protein
MTAPNPKALIERLRDAPHHEQMAHAQSGCVPCKLCGGKAIITDAGIGAGYYIKCENSGRFRASKGCMLDEVRLGGWAYNVRDWWNRLHSASDRLTAPDPKALVKRLRECPFCGGAAEVNESRGAFKVACATEECAVEVGAWLMGNNARTPPSPPGTAARPTA